MTLPFEFGMFAPVLLIPAIGFGHSLLYIGFPIKIFTETLTSAPALAII